MEKSNNKNINVHVNKLKLFSLEVLIVLFAFILSSVIVYYLIIHIIPTEGNSFDEWAFRFVGAYTHDRNTTLMSFITLFGSQYFLVPTFLFMIFFYAFFKKNKWMGLKVTAVSFSSLFLMFGLKWYFQRPRPLTPLLKEASGLSFPSGHAFMSFSLCGILIYIIYKEVKNIWVKWLGMYAMLVFTFFVGLSRVYLRVHYASDVIAGFCMGFMWVVIALTIMSKLEKHKGKLPEIHEKK